MRGKKELLAGWILALALSFMLCFYAPLEMYFQNVFDFWYDAYTLIPVLLIMFLVVMLVQGMIFSVVYFMNKNAYRIWLVLSFIIYIASYIQGNFLVGNLLVLDGSEIDWSQYASGRIASIVVYMVVSGIVIFVYYRFKRDFFEEMVKAVSICMTLMLLVTIITLGRSGDAMMRKTNYCITYKDIMQMSRDTNFVILVMDTIDGSKFSKMLNEHPEFKETFEDFTYYDNTMAAYPFTEFSIPFILSGRWYENECSQLDYFDEAYGNSAFLNKMLQSDYRVGIYSSDMPLNQDYYGNYDNVIAKNGSITTPFRFMMNQMKLAGLRYAPFDLKRFCVFDVNDFWDMMEIEGWDIVYNFSNSNKKFYDMLLQDDIKLVKDRCFKFIHLEGAHVPFRYDKDVHIVTEGATYESGVEASVRIVDAYLDKLKEAGIYDNTVVMVMSDHGYDPSDEGWKSRQDAILLVKGIGEKHPMQISSAPISFDDLQGAYDRLWNGADSMSIFDYKENDVRERRFLWHSLDDEELLIEYIQTGAAADEDTLIPTGREFYYSE
ncbi:MAG: sulfatase-like hydrolase/transferase [Lachnospiraceae bacterium]